MKLFLKNIILVLIIILVITTGAFCYKIYSVRNAKWKIPERANTILVGASGTGVMITEWHYPDLYSFWANSTSPFFSYIRLKKILNSDNPQIKTAILEFSPFFASGNYDAVILEDGSSFQLFSRYVALFNREQSDYYLSHYGSFFKMLSKGSIMSIAIGDNISKKNNRDVQKVTTKVMADDTKYAYIEKFNARYNAYNYFGNKVSLNYLRKSIDLCHENNIEVALITAPVIKEAYKLYGDNPVEILNDLHEKYFSDVSYYNFLLLDLPESWYYNADHLNDSGAEYVSKLLYSKMSDK